MASDVDYITLEWIGDHGLGCQHTRKEPLACKRGWREVGGGNSEDLALVTVMGSFICQLARLQSSVI